MGIAWLSEEVFAIGVPPMHPKQTRELSRSSQFLFGTQSP